MDIKAYFASIYKLIKTIFADSSVLDNSILIGAVREYLANQLLAFFPEPRETGWIFDQRGNSTGQIDLLLVLNKALRIPGVLLGDSPVNGFFATQVCAAFEIKSGLGSSMNELMNKTWQCHRLFGGFSADRVTETFDGQQFAFDFGGGVPVCIVGNGGFAQPSTYLDNHFSRFGEIEYTVNKKQIPAPRELGQVVPELLLDFTHDTLMVKNSLKPDLLRRLFKSDEGTVVTNEFFTTFTKLDDGRALMAILYYLDSIRLDLSMSQLGMGTPLLEVFKD